MRRTILTSLCLLSCLLLSPSVSAAGDVFLAELEDLPLAPGLIERPGGLLFDSADGRIVEASASGEANPEQVRLFYETSLRQLGWQSLAPLQFRRDNEILRIVIDEHSRPLIVHFTLSPTH